MEMVNKLLKLNYKVIVVPYIQNPEFKLIHSCRKNLVISLYNFGEGKKQERYFSNVSDTLWPKVTK